MLTAPAMCSSSYSSFGSTSTSCAPSAIRRCTSSRPISVGIAVILNDAPNEVQRRGRSSSADRLPVTPERELDAAGRVGTLGMDVHEPDRLLVGCAAGPGDARHGHGDV